MCVFLCSLLLAFVRSSLFSVVSYVFYVVGSCLLLLFVPSLLFVPCVLFVVRCLLFVVGCLLFVFGCFVFVVRCLLFGVC